MPARPRAALLAGFLGWTLDAFDFFLVVLSATAIAAEFGRPDRDVALSIALTLGCRPVGAFLFGLVADRWGRRLPLMIDLVFYAACEVATGLVHEWRTFLVLRALFGVGMGGEWGVGASLAMEHAPAGRRGLASGLLQEGYAAGYLLAALAYFVVFPRWGWRPLFFLGGLPALLALYVRLHVTESEAWRRTRHPTLGALARAIAGQWRTLVYLVVLMTGMNLASHGTQDLFPTFLERQFHLGPAARAGLTAWSMVGAILGGVVFGRWSDRVGRRRAIVVALAGAIAVVPLWAFSPSLALLALGAFAIQLFVQGAWGVVPAHLNELAPAGARGFLPGFAYQAGVLLAGPVAYVEARLAERMSYAQAMAATAVGVFLVAAVATALGRERRGIDLG